MACREIADEFACSSVEHADSGDLDQFFNVLLWVVLVDFKVTNHFNFAAIAFRCLAFFDFTEADEQLHTEVVVFCGVACPSMLGAQRASLGMFNVIVCRSDPDLARMVA